MAENEFILLNVLGLALIAALCIALTALYWRRILKRIRTKSHQERMKRMVECYRESQKIKSKEAFMYNILHEVQALQEGLDSFLKLFSATELTISSEDWDEASLMLRQRIERLSAIVNGSLVMMQYEDMTEVAKEDDVAVIGFCEDVFQSCMSHLREGVDTKIESSLKDDYQIRTNMACLDVLLRYLILCSMEYTTEGHITLKIAQSEKKDKLIFTLSDTGLGIPDDMKNIVFERLPLSNIRHKITGVRLRTCRTLVKLLGGIIRVDQHYEGGTSIVFTIS